MHFINGGDTGKDIEYRVTRLRDERRFANRRVDAVQDGTLLSSALISYMAGGRGLEHGVDPPRVADPETQPTIGELLHGYEETVPHFVNALQPIEWRYTNDPAWVMRMKGERLPHNRVWVKALGKLPDDPVLHTATMVYSSGHHGAGLRHHHARSFLGIRPHFRRLGQPFHLVSPSGRLQRLGAVLHVVAGGRGFARAGHRAFLRPVRATAGHRRAGGCAEILSLRPPVNRYAKAAGYRPETGRYERDRA